jgi:sugar lactone lactonase YvrE
MTSLKTILLLVVVAFAGAAHAADGACAPSGDLQFVCGPKNAEDLVAVPGTKWLLSSGMADGGGVMLIDTRNGAWHVAYPNAASGAAHDSKYADCTTPPDPAKLQTHGLNLLPGRNGHSALYAVAHGARESIEVFDVDASGKEPKLTWQGCVPMPEGLAANSVASFADGSLVATVLLMPGKSFADSVAKRPTGAVFEWSPGKRGFTLVRGSELPGNNGIETSPDGREIFVVSSGFQTIVAFSHENPTRQLRTTRPLPFTPDNVHRGLDGRLRTAGMANDVPECGGAPGPQHDLAKLASCPRGTIAMEIDPRTMKDTVVVQTPANKDFSNATMVLVQDGQFWLGTFQGDRIAHGPLR